MSRKTQRNVGKSPSLEHLERMDSNRMNRLRSGATEDGQRWVNRSTFRGYKKEQAKKAAVERISTVTRLQEGAEKE
jgi:hypothetical protein